MAVVGCAGTRAQPAVAQCEQDLNMARIEMARLRAQQVVSSDLIQKENERITKELRDEIQQGQVTIVELQGRLTLSVVEDLLFDSGKAELHDTGRKLLARIASTLGPLDGQIVMVEGHTDNIPIGQALAEKYPTNWELSTARATTVVRYLQDHGVRPTELAAVGYGEYKPVAPNSNAAGRHKNRRIDVVLGAARAEPQAEGTKVSAR